MPAIIYVIFFFSSRRRHTRLQGDWSSDVCSSDLFTVRRQVKGGSRPTAYLLAFTLREVEPPALTWLHVRLVDTRTGAIVAAVAAPLDSLGATTAARVRAIVDSLAANPALKRPLPPS